MEHVSLPQNVQTIVEQPLEIVPLDLVFVVYSQSVELQVWLSVRTTLIFRIPVSHLFTQIPLHFPILWTNVLIVSSIQHKSSFIYRSSSEISSQKLNFISDNDNDSIFQWLIPPFLHMFMSEVASSKFKI